MAKQQKRRMQFYVESMQRHVRIHIAATYCYIDDVVKNPNATSKQQLKTKKKPKTNATHNPSRGSEKFSTSHKEKTLTLNNKHINPSVTFQIQKRASLCRVTVR